MSHTLRTTLRDGIRFSRAAAFPLLERGTSSSLVSQSSSRNLGQKPSTSAKTPCLSSHIELQVQIRRRQEELGRASCEILRIRVLSLQLLLERVELETLPSIRKCRAQPIHEGGHLLGQGESTSLA